MRSRMKNTRAVPSHGRPPIWARAQQLNPEDWNYHRQDWSFTPQEASKKWLDKFQKLDQSYYPKLEIKPPESK